MHVLMIHPEAKFFAGAEKVLDYLLQGCQQTDLRITVAAVPGSRVDALIPPGCGRIPLEDNQRFRCRVFGRQVRQIAQANQQSRFDVLHGWAVRDWELTSACGVLLRRPTLATLHDPPNARFFSWQRKRLMAWSGRWFLDRIACVSGALRDICQQMGFPPSKLAVVHNGLPALPIQPSHPSSRFRLGYLGVFSERKGFDGLFETLDRLSNLSKTSWELHVAGDAQDEAGRQLLAAIQAKYSHRPWWSLVTWHGWIKDPLLFLNSVDALVCPSREFDPFPTVLLEAGLCSRPVVASRVGGVAEIVDEGQTGWLFSAGAWEEAARRLAELMAHPLEGHRAGTQARKRVEEEFSIAKMVAGYRNLYSTLERHDW